MVQDELSCRQVGFYTVDFLNEFYFIAHTYW